MFSNTFEVSNKYRPPVLLTSKELRGLLTCKYCLQILCKIQKIEEQKVDFYDGFNSFEYFKVQEKDSVYWVDCTHEFDTHVGQPLGYCSPIMNGNCRWQL